MFEFDNRVVSIDKKYLNYNWKEQGTLLFNFLSND